MKQALKQLKKYFTIWWIPIVGYLMIIGVFLLGVLLRRDWIIDFSLMVFFLNIIGTIISSIVQIAIRKWYVIFPQLGLAAFLFYYVGIIFTYSPPDYYGAHKEIPKHIDFLYPLDSLPMEKEYELNDLVLISGSQPGIYNFQTKYIPSDIGYFYIKAFEINSNDRLSGERMKLRSKTVVKNLQHQIHKGRFTIYEGDWGDEYGSRIELWYQPANGEEYKVQERHYIIEGWQR